LHFYFNSSAAVVDATVAVVVVIVAAPLVDCYACFKLQLKFFAITRATFQLNKYNAVTFIIYVVKEKMGGRGGYSVTINSCGETQGAAHLKLSSNANTFCVPLNAAAA